MPDRAETATLPQAICARHGNDPASLIEILHDLQEAEGYVPDAALPEIARALNIGKAEVHGVVSFYHDFHAAPTGRLVVKLCRAEACQSMGATTLIERILARRGAALGETDAHGVRVDAVYCLGNCALAPAAMVGERLVGRLTEARLDATVAEALT